MSNQGRAERFNLMVKAINALGVGEVIAKDSAHPLQNIVLEAHRVASHQLERLGKRAFRLEKIMCGPKFPE